MPLSFMECIAPLIRRRLIGDYFDGRVCNDNFCFPFNRQQSRRKTPQQEDTDAERSDEHGNGRGNGKNDARANEHADPVGHHPARSRRCVRPGADRPMQPRVELVREAGIGAVPHALSDRHCV